mmetsp:Transcript_80559/g.184509  ORF Transcript_80559/g.184509 Transcript_80559/m.184509 type:complete len:237 (-) Transcript_80559:653-1363(-)
MRGPARGAAHAHTVNRRSFGDRESSRLASLAPSASGSVPGIARNLLLPRSSSSRKRHRALEANATTNRPDADTTQVARSGDVENTHLAHATARGVEPQLASGALKIDGSQICEQSRAAQGLSSADGRNNNCENRVHRVGHAMRHWRQLLPSRGTADSLLEFHRQVRKIGLQPLLVDRRPGAVGPHRLRRHAHMPNGDLPPVPRAQGLHQRIAADQQALRQQSKRFAGLQQGNELRR